MSEDRFFGISKRKLTEADQGFHTEGIENIENFGYLSYSRVKLLNQSLHSFRRRYILGFKPKDTPAKEFGRLIHSALLEPKDFLGRYVIDKKFSGKGSVLAKAEWREEQAIDALILSQENADKILFMIDSVQNHKEASQILEGANFEVKAYYKSEKLNQWFFMVIDFLKKSIVGDLKSAATAVPKDYGRDIYKMGYHIQAAIYLDAANEIMKTKNEEFPHIVIENVEPYHTMLYWIPKFMIEKGRNIRDRVTIQYQKKMKEHFKDPKNTIWPGYNGLTGISEAVIPRWVITEIENETDDHTGF